MPCQAVKAEATEEGRTELKQKVFISSRERKTFLLF
jgi:hypothetical protein